jgi:hypothetical protein
MADATGAVVEEQKPETTTIGKKKVEKTGNLILDIAHEVEGLTKVKALNLAENLAENIEVNYFKLGGVLKLINDNSWFEGAYEGFDRFVIECKGFGVARRDANQHLRQPRLKQIRGKRCRTSAGPN